MRSIGVASVGLLLAACTQEGTSASDSSPTTDPARSPTARARMASRAGSPPEGTTASPSCYPARARKTPLIRTASATNALATGSAVLEPVAGSGAAGALDATDRVAGATGDGEVPLDHHEAARRVDAFGFLVVQGARGVIGDQTGIEVDAHGLAAAVEVGGEDQLVVRVGVAVVEGSENARLHVRTRRAPL